MWFSVLEILMLVLLAAAPAWFWGGPLWAALAACALLLWILLRQIWKIRRLELWLSQPDWRTELPWKGVWAEIAQRIQRQLRQNDKLLLTSEQRLQYFLQAIQASPNGVTLLDAEGRIEWCNATASNHLGLDAKRDVKQHIVHLLRDPVFSKYFAQGQHDAEVIIDGRSNSLIQTPKLSVQLHAYGESQFLLLSRDITSVTLADAMRRDFVANVSHEIRTPLTVLSGFIETLGALPLTGVERERVIKLMAQQADRMQHLVADLLTLAQIEGSPLPSADRWLGVETLMQRIESDARGLSRERHPLSFDWAAYAHGCEIAGEESEWLSAMGNLVSNAIRYTPEGRPIAIRWVCLPDGRAEFSVKDEGPGIAPEHIPRLTERFYRADSSRSRDTGGTGLGLSIVKHVVQRHGGELRIESEPGKGSVFTLVVPAGRVRRTSAPLAA